MSTVITVKLDRKLPGLNQILHAAKKEQAMMKREYTAYIVRELNRQGVVPEEAYRHIKLSIDFYERETGRDFDNVLIGLKFICDGLVCAGLIDDDDLQHITPGSFEFHTQCKKYGSILTMECTEFEDDF